jgi:hypothetical protein
MTALTTSQNSSTAGLQARLCLLPGAAQFGAVAVVEEHGQVGVPVPDAMLAMLCVTGPGGEFPAAPGRAEVLDG